MSLLVFCTERNDQIRILKAESAELAAQLASERAISARFLRERDDGISAIRLQMTRLTAELATEQAIVARLFQERTQHVAASRQHVALSCSLGDYTSQFLDAKSVSDRAALLASIRNTSLTILGGRATNTCEGIANLMRTMMGNHGFVLRGPGEGQREWPWHNAMLTLVTGVEVLDGLVRARLESHGSQQWYLLELLTVVLRVAEYLEANP